ncbi:MAG TPA: diacylglycerol kinase family protein [Gemmatimonadaceae bacterium]
MAELTIIVNPASGRGRARSLLGGIESAFAAFRPRYEVSTGPGAEERLAREAADRGAETIVAVGGDGTWGNVAHGIVQSGASPRVALLAAGTGNDFAKSAGVPADDPHATAALVRSGSTRRVDLGAAGERVFLNCCGTGFDTAVLERNARLPVLRGPIRYMAAAMAEILTYRGERVAISPWTDTAAEPTLLTVFANGAWYGGMFHIAPDAAPDDGVLEAVRIRDVRGAQRVGLLLSAIRGRHIGRAGVEVGRGSGFTLDFASPPLVNTDGEVRRAASTQLTVRVLPGALRLVAPL